MTKHMSQAADNSDLLQIVSWMVLARLQEPAAAAAAAVALLLPGWRGEGLGGGQVKAQAQGRCLPWPTGSGAALTRQPA